jgi:cell division protease FtsH
MDAEVRAMLERLYARTRDILIAHQPALEALAQALLARETLDGVQALAILETHGVPMPETVPVTVRA